MTSLPRLAFARLADPPPAGTLQFYDGYFGALAPGDYTLTVTHAVTLPTGPATYQVTQPVTVQGPQFTIDPTLAITAYPPAGAVGAYDDDVAYLVLADPALPWARALVPSGAMPTPAAPTPWVALAIFTDGEIVLPPGSASPITTTTVGELLAPSATVQKPVLTEIDAATSASQVATITITGAAFQALLPLSTELAYLAHCQADQTTGTPSLVSAVIGNRLAVAPSGPTRYYAHLVSLEGLGGFLGPDGRLPPQPGTTALVDVQLVSLFAWSFTSTPEPGLDFAQLVTGLVASETATAGLALPPASGLPTEAAARLADGYVALDFDTGAGDTFAWYRGPLTPVVPQPVPAVGDPPVEVGQATSADALLIYVAGDGVFDASYAAAWNLGRGLALADGAFTRAIVRLRTAARTALGTLALRDRLPVLADVDDVTARLAPDAVRRATATQLGDGLGRAWIDTLSSVGAAERPASGRSGRARRAARPPRPDLRGHLAAPATAAALAAATSDVLDEVAAWIANLVTLAPVPFANLVPDPRMLPVESIRFAYVDPTWLAALTAGALSLGLHGSVDVALQRALAPAIAARLATATSAPAQSAVLIRSQLVTAWPDTQIAASLAGAALPVVRDAVLAPAVRLVIFDGVPDTVTLAQPYRGLQLGVEDAAAIAVRSVGGAQAVGAPLGTSVTAPLRTPASGAVGGVLDVAALVPLLVAATGAASFGAGDLALQLVVAPETQSFTPEAS